MNNLRKLYADNRRQAERRFEVRAAADGSAAEVFLYDAIVADPLEAEFFGGVAPEPFVKALRALNVGTINLRINSPGGSVFAGRAIEQALRDHPAKVVAHVDGVAASAAAFIAMGADEVVMGKGALMMIHKAWSLAYGNADDLISAAALLEKIDSTQVQTFADRTGQSPEQLNEWLAAETWFTADEAVAAGFADRVAEAAPKAQARWDLSAYAHAPQLPAEPAPPEPDRVDASALLRRLAVAALTD
jgi:ATP-dependent Clp protease protease subunit